MRPATRVNVPTKNPKGKYPFQKGKTLLKRKGNVERNEAINKWTSMREIVFVHVVFSLSVYYSCTKC